MLSGGRRGERESGLRASLCQRPRLFGAKAAAALRASLPREAQAQAAPTGSGRVAAAAALWVAPSYPSLGDSHALGGVGVETREVFPACRTLLL
jgi:hypothetical protein